MAVRKTKRPNSNQKRSTAMDHSDNTPTTTTNSKPSPSSDTSSLTSTNSHNNNSKPPTISMMPSYQPEPNQDEEKDSLSIKQDEEDQTITMMPKYHESHQPQQQQEEEEKKLKETDEKEEEEEETMTPPLDSPNSVIPNSIEPTTPTTNDHEHEHKEFDPTTLLQICPMPSEFKQPSIDQIKESINKQNDQDNEDQEKTQDQVDNDHVQVEKDDKDQVDDKKSEYRQLEYKQYFAPWNVPLVRRRQTFAHVFNLFLLLGSHTLTLFCLINPFLWPFFIAYLIFIAFDNSPEEGARAISWWRKSPLWKWYADFYPARLINEADLDPQRNYIFGYHPHGIIGMGALTNFATDATGVDKIFPGLNIRTLTLSSNFRIPFYREHLLSLGAASVSKQSIRNILGKGPGHSCVIVVGGAEEALEAKPDRANLILARRYGFIKMALECGADLVPTFGFGENQLYDQANNEPGTWLHFIQHRFKALTGLTPPLFYGRGIFLYRIGIFPHRIPLTVVTGKPIPVERTSNPTEDQIKSLHTQYLTALTDLYDRNKGAYWVGSNPPELNFV